jgi:GT2 family glycosyltransferase
MSSENVVIGVVPRDRFSMFPQCLEALYTHTDVPFRVVVVAGGTDVATRQYLQNLQERKTNMSVVLVDRLLMQGEARNVAMRQAKERFFVVLENDTIVHENWLCPLLDCVREEEAAVVAPLILDFWDRGIHAAGCVFKEREKDGIVEFHHQVMYTGMKTSSVPLQRMRIDYAETHCILIDRQLLPDHNLFEDVEPFDADLGLTLRQQGLIVLLEPRSVATYVAPPPLEVRDIAAFKFRWDAAAWAARNRHFMQKWKVTYDASRKQISYRRQHLKLGLARWYPNKFTVWMSNTYVGFLKSLRSSVMRLRNERRAPR